MSFSDKTKECNARFNIYVCFCISNTQDFSQGGTIKNGPSPGTCGYSDLVLYPDVIINPDVY